MEHFRYGLRVPFQCGMHSTTRALDAAHGLTSSESVNAHRLRLAEQTVL